MCSPWPAGLSGEDQRDATLLEISAPAPNPFTETLFSESVKGWLSKLWSVLGGP